MKKIFIALITIIILIGGIGAFVFFQGKGSNETSSKYKEFSFICEGEDIPKDDFAKIEGQYYLSLDFIKEYLDDDISYDEAEKTVIFINDEGTTRIVLGEEKANKNGKEVELRDPVIKENGKILIPSEIFIHDYPVSFRFIEDKDLLLMDYDNIEYSIGISTGKGLNVRESASIKSPLVAILGDGDEVYVYGEKGDFYKVRLKDGYAGYIKKSYLDVKYPENKIEFKKNKEEKKEAKKGPLNLTWDYTYAEQSMESISNITKIDGLNVVCPTWFSIKDSDSNIIDRGKVEYVNKYKSLGIDVWGYLDNSFNSELTHNVLSKSSSREKIITKTLELVKKYNLSGINIDFEQTKIDDRDYITQFVRELAAVFHKENLIVSVDVTPQISSDVSKEPYDRKELAEVADYVMVMTYDQHWKNSKEAGSVAAYNWVEANLNTLFKQIPKEKMVLCIPFYSRLWKENGSKVESDNISMIQQNEIITKNDLTPEWDEKTKQNYVEFKKDNILYKIWIEDDKSIEYKVSLVNKYNLAGVASWKKGLETSDIWESINKTLSK